MVVIDQIEAAGRRNGVELMVGQLLPKMFARGTAGAIELIVGVIHLVAAHHGFQAAFVEGAVVCHKGQTLDEWFNLPPDIRKHRRVFGVLAGDAVDKRVPIVVVVRLRLDEGIERVHELAIANDDYTDAAHAGALVVGGLKVYGGEGVHFKLAIKS